MNETGRPPERPANNNITALNIPEQADEQLTLDAELADDELDWHTWFVSLPLDPWDEGNPVRLPVEEQRRPEERAA